MRVYNMNISRNAHICQVFAYFLTGSFWRFYIMLTCLFKKKVFLICEYRHYTAFIMYYREKKLDIWDKTCIIPYHGKMVPNIVIIQDIYMYIVRATIFVYSHTMLVNTCKHGFCVKLAIEELRLLKKIPLIPFRVTPLCIFWVDNDYFTINQNYSL